MPLLAARIAISTFTSNDSATFQIPWKAVHPWRSEKTGENVSLISKGSVWGSKKACLPARLIDHLWQGFYYDYFGFKTLERSYLLKLDGKVVEKTTAHADACFSSVSITMTLMQPLRPYNFLSEKYFNSRRPCSTAGTPVQLSSCFLLTTKRRQHRRDIWYHF